MKREKIVEGHSTKPVHQERTTYPPGGLGDLGAYELRSIHWQRRIEGGYMQSHCREATGTDTPFDKYAQAYFVKYAEAQSRSDCYAVRRGVAASVYFKRA